MHVLKRDGSVQPVRFDKVSARIRRLCRDDLRTADPLLVAHKVIGGLYDGVSTAQLDDLAAETAAALTTVHPDYGRLAARIAVSNLHKKTEPGLFADPRVAAAVDWERDYALSYFAVKTLEKSYLLSGERPQGMWMRVALHIHGDDVERALETYRLLSEKWFTHATPTLYNAGTASGQLASCFLMPLQQDSIPGIFDTLKRCALISKRAGGIGLALHGLSAPSLVPVLRLFNDAARFVHQNGRPGAFAVYLEPWHEQILDFLAMKKNTGAEEQRARDLFYGLWIPDLFMRRVEEDGDWSLMCPRESPGLDDRWGDEFRQLYERFEARGQVRRRVRARLVWRAILESQIESGTPYMMYKDACNRKSNQRHLGTIKCGNLCTEIVEYSAPDEVAVCNLASVALNKFVVGESFDFAGLRRVVAVVTRNLNRVIDVSTYPLPEAERSNKRHRPIGIGVQGLADAFLLMRYPFDSEEARALNRAIFENIYYAALEASCELARECGRPHESFEGSPASRGVLQFDMWSGGDAGLQLDWPALKAKIALHGLRNGLLVAPMPTASTAQILGNNEGIEPYTSNVYVRRVLSGEFVVVNPHLLEDLIRLGLWGEGLKQQLIADYGSVQKIPGFPPQLKRLYRTAWEIPQKSLIEMAADRGRFVDQSQSLNLFVAEPTFAKLSSMHFYAWKLGLKTGMYYLRTRPAAHAVQFTVDKCSSCAA